MYKSISKLLQQINNIMLIYPSSPIENFVNINCQNIRKTIYSINENNQLINSFSFKDKKIILKNYKMKILILIIFEKILNQI